MHRNAKFHGSIFHEVEFLKKNLHRVSKILYEFSISGTQSFVQNLLAYPGLGHSGPLDLDGGGSSGGECPSVCTSTGGTPQQVSSLPPAMRVRLYELFVQIEREFEILYAENISLQVRYHSNQDSHMNKNYM